MHKIEQIAMKTVDIGRRIATIGSLYEHGPVTTMKLDAEWVRDEVRARHVFIHSQYMPANELGREFGVQLAFNYGAIPTRELELIQLDFGRSVQLVRNEDMGLAHLGYHIPDEGNLLREIEAWNLRGFTCAQVSMTVNHSNTSRRYLYAFIDTLEQIGAFTKVIWRRQNLETEMPEFIREFEHVNVIPR